MSTETPTPVLVVGEARPAQGPAHASGEPRPERRSSRTRRRAEQQRQRRSLVAAIVVCAAVPSIVVLTLWDNLTEPFWFNEQWRAYYISNSGNWWGALKVDGAPFPAGWYFLERIAGGIFGSTELVLRIPTALFLPVGCVLLLLLARRAMPIGAALIVALVGTMTGTLVSYALQLSEYQIDAACAVAVVLLHEIVWDVEQPTWRSRRVLLAYGGIALACIFSTPVVFIAGPLLLLDAVRSLRRPVGPRLVGAVGAGVITLAHLALFVLPQSALRASPYWDQQFLPHHGFGGQASFIWDGLRGFVTGVFTSSAQSGQPGLVLGTQWAWVLTLAFGALLCVGVVDAARSSRGRTLLFAIVAAQVLTLIASSQRYWPFGFVRTNYYLIPLLLLLAGVGGVVTGRFGLSLLRPVQSSSRTVTAGRRVIGVVLCVVVLTAVGLAVTSEVGAYRQIRGSVSAAQYGARIGSVVTSVQDTARAGAAVVVTGGVMTDPGWKYYGYEYGGKATKSGRQVPLSRVTFPAQHGSPAITAMINRLDPSQVFLYIPNGTTGSEVGQDTVAITRGGQCRQQGSKGFGVSGLLITFSCAPAG
jgi:hypothetical protein